MRTIFLRLLVCLALPAIALSAAFSERFQTGDVKTDRCDPKCGPYAYTFEKDLELANPIDFYFDAEFLLMQVREDGLEYALINTNANGSSGNRFPVTGGDVESFSSGRHHTDWNYGFRANMGFYMPHDNWNLDARWTYIRIKEDKSTHVQGTGVALPLWLGAYVDLQGNNKDASARWSGNFNTLDIRLGKPFHVSYFFVMHPHVGLRAAFIGQSYLARYCSAIGVAGTASTVGAEMKADNDYWGVGIRGGIETEWLFGKGWFLFGNFAAAILYGQFDIDQSTDTTGGGYTIHDHVTTNSPDFDVALGLAWGHYFLKDTFHLTLKFAYEFQNWTDMNRFRKFYDSNTDSSANQASPISNETVSRGDMTINGFAFKILMDF